FCYLRYLRAPVTPFPYTTLFRSLLPVYVRSEYDSAAYFGVLVTALGIGMLVGILLFGAIGHRARRYGIFLGGFALAVAATWLFADRKSTRLNSSHVKISYAVFCL